MMTPMLSESISLSEQLASNLPASTRGNVNIIGSGGNSTAVCYMPYLIGFSHDGNPVNDLGYYQGMASILLAMEHLNTGNGTIIPDIDGINHRCPLHFTTKSFDTETQQSVGIDHMISMTDRSNEEQLIPCAILGAAWSSISIPTSIISGLRDFPQISPISTSASLDDKSQHPLFGRTVPNDDGTAVALLSKLHNEWGVNHLAVLHVDDAYGNAFAEGIRLTAQKEHEGLRVQYVDLVDGADGSKIAAAVQSLKATEYTYFVGIIHDTDVDKVMEEAYNQGIAGTGKHTWIFSDSVGAHPLRSFEVGSPQEEKLETAYRGSGLISATGGIPGMSSFDKLTESLQQMGKSKQDLDYLESLLPQEHSSGKVVNHTIITGDGTFLQLPGLVAPFLYDAVVALGLASCRLADSLGNGFDSSFVGEEMFQAYLATTFNGTSGTIVFAESGTRDPQSALFSLTNFIRDEESSGGSIQLKEVQTDLYRSGRWESMVPFQFNDGTNKAPADLPFPETNSNHLVTAWQAVGSVLCAAIVSLVLAFGLWTKHNSKRSVVRSSQPVFLYIILAGALLMGLAIVPLTISRSNIDRSIADSACMAFPWLLATGFSLTFSALFTKTYRIIKIMQSARQCRRLVLKPVDVMKPMAALLALNGIILTVWTVIDPLWLKTNELKVDKFGRTVKTYGSCTSEHSDIFVAILCVINLGSLVYALFEAYKARHISTDYQESQYIFIAMTLILMVSFIGIPITIIAKENLSAYYFVTVGIISVVCGSILFLIFAPKVRALRKKNIPSNAANRTNTLGQVTNQENSPVEGVRIVSFAGADLEQVRAELNEEIQELTGENRELKEEIQVLTKKNEDLKGGNKDSNRRVSEQEKAELKEEIQELKGENQGLKDYIKKIESHNTELQDSKQGVCDMEEEYDYLEGKLEKRERESEDNDREIEEKDVTMRMWKAQGKSAVSTSSVAPKEAVTTPDAMLPSSFGASSLKVGQTHGLD